MEIENPIKIEVLPYSFEIIESHILHVISQFPNEYRMIRHEENEINILQIPLQAVSSIDDRIIKIKMQSQEKSCSINIETTNQDNKIKSYTEREILIKNLETFYALLNQSLNGVLEQRMAQAISNANPTNGPQAFVQFLILIAAVAAIFVGVKGCVH